MAEQWLSIVEYARASGISDMTIRRRIRTGKIKAELKDGKYFIPVDLRGEIIGHPTQSSQKVVSPPVIVKSNRHPENFFEQTRGADTTGSLTEKIMPVIMRTDTENQVHHGVMPGQIPNWLTSTPSSSPQSLVQSIGQSTSQSSHAPVTLPTFHRPGMVPESLSRPLVEMGQASIEARSLLEFCDQALSQAKTTIVAVESKYAARLEAADAQLRQKDQEIRALNQQIEDLQLLVQILERKKTG